VHDLLIVDVLSVRSRRSLIVQAVPRIVAAP